MKIYVKTKQQRQKVDLVMIFKVIYNMNYLSYYKMYTSIHLLKKMIAVDVERPTPFVKATGYVLSNIHTYRYL